MPQDFEMTRSFMVEQPPPLPDLVVPDNPTEEAAARAAAKKLSVPYVDLRQHDFHPQTVKLITEVQARRFKALVLEDRGDSYFVGFADPWDLRAQDEVSALLRRNVEVGVITHEQLKDTIEKVYRKTEQIGQFAKEVGQDVQAQERVVDLIQEKLNKEAQPCC